MTARPHCRARACGRPIPVSQQFCRACLAQLSTEIRHRLLFGTDAEKEAALAAADAALSTEPRNEAVERFRAARKHAAAAMKTLERGER